VLLWQGSAEIPAYQMRTAARGIGNPKLAIGVFVRFERVGASF
jgi:hypothetical protein